jgi:hypothetical protein
MVLDEAALAIRVAKAQLSALTGLGMRQPPDSVVDFKTEGVAAAIAFLKRCRPAKKPLSSYWFKHAAEEWGSRNGMASYVTNGELIAAAVYLDFKTRWDGRSPNVEIGVSVQDGKRLAAGEVPGAKNFRDWVAIARRTQDRGRLRLDGRLLPNFANDGPTGGGAVRLGLVQETIAFRPWASLRRIVPESVDDGHAPALSTPFLSASAPAQTAAPGGL